MAARRKKPRTSVARAVLDVDEASLLDVIDNVVNKGAMATGDITLGLAGVDLIYLRLSTLLCAADRVLPPNDAAAPPRPRRRPAGGRPAGRRR